MVHASYGMHHLLRRKRLKSRRRPDNRKKLKKFLDKAVYIVAAVSLVMTLPQLLQVWIVKNAAGVSAVSWGFYAVASVFWLVYGIVHREKPLMIINIMWFAMQLLIAIGAVLYG